MNQTPEQIARDMPMDWWEGKAAYYKY